MNIDKSQDVLYQFYRICNKYNITAYNLFYVAWNSPISSQKPGDQEEREDDYSESDDNLKTGDDLETSDNLETVDDEEINDDQNKCHTCITCGS